MTYVSYKNWNGVSDRAICEFMGGFVRQSRIRMNKTQGQLAEEAGVARSTLSLFEKGENSSLMVFIQLLRALNMLHLLGEFEVREQFSPLELAKLQKKSRLRVRHNEVGSKNSSGRRAQGAGQNPARETRNTKLL